MRTTVFVFTALAIATASFLRPAHAQEKSNSSIAAVEKEDQSDSSANQSEAEPPDGFDLAVNLASFNQVWETINATHWDEKLLKDKWLGAREKFRPQIESARSIGEVRKTIQSMIDELELSHFGIIPRSSLEVIQSNDSSEDNEGGSGDASAGLQFRNTKDGVVVSQVLKGSSADEAGVEPGWIVQSIGHHDIDDVMQRLTSATHGPIRLETVVGMTLPALASGSSGTKKSFRFLDRNSEVREMEIELRPVQGKFVTFGHLPPVRLQTRVETLPGGIGYIWFNTFMDPITLMTLFRSTIRNEDHQAGVIIDLRGNNGGLAGMTMGMASEFSDRQATLGIMSMRGTELKFFVNENADPVTCPVALLVDECSISSAEILAGGLQDLKLARIFGGRTAGLALPSTVVRLPNGDGFQYALANYHSASGKSLEKNGVQPDVTVELTRELLLADSDPALSQAIAWINTYPAPER